MPLKVLHFAHSIYFSRMTFRKISDNFCFGFETQRVFKEVGI